jgi:hypothetical protein
MADQSAEYLIRKNGAYYRPNANGYTNDRHQAGRFTLAEAISYSHPNGRDGPRDGITYELAPAYEQASLDLAASARALRDAGLLGQADYQRAINRIQARDSVRRFKEIVA